MSYEMQLWIDEVLEEETFIEWTLNHHYVWGY